MKRTAVLQGVRVMKFRDVFGRCERRELSKVEASELLGVSEQTSRLLRRFCGHIGQAARALSPGLKRGPLRVRVRGVGA